MRGAIGGVSVSGASWIAPDRWIDSFSCVTTSSAEALKGHNTMGLRSTFRGAAGDDIDDVDDIAVVYLILIVVVCV